MSVESNIKKYYAYRFFMCFSFWLPIFIIFLLDRGLNYTEIMLISVTAASVQIILEVPSGVFADFFGRKKSLINLVIFVFARDFKTFMIGAVFFGAAMAFESGSGSAFIYDTLKDLKKEKQYKKIEGTAFSYSLVGMGIGAFFGGYLAEINLAIPVAATAASVFLAFLIACTFKESKHKKKSSDTKYFEHLKNALVFAAKHPKVRWLLIFSGSMTALMVISHKFVQPYLQLNGISLQYFGVIYMVFLLFGALSAKNAHVIEGFIGEMRSLLLIPVLLSINLIIMGAYVSLFGILTIFLGQFSLAFTKPVILD